MNYKTEMIEGMIHAVSDIRPGRCVGNTTRQVNDTIDLFFSLPKGQKHVGFKDHSGVWIGDKYMRGQIERRLALECRCRNFISEPKSLNTGVPCVLLGKNYIKALNF